jgi:CDP-glucose 4,6-dehydratase
MESMVSMKNLFGGIYQGKKVLVTGFTGFKGSWLAQWLKLLGADVYGYALNAPSDPSHYSLLKMDINECIADVRDAKALSDFIEEIKPEIVFHLAAQALVRESYSNPSETFSTNVMGTLNVYESCRKTSSVGAIVNITSDKCYENKEWIWGYRENDPMGGFDPYSASKGCAEILTSSFRNSYFNLNEYKKSHHLLLASARAGNVIGGGDWATDRLIPDMIRAASLNNSVQIRNPKATRPWQHVLEPLSGYLTLGWRLLEERMEFADGWNFGPDLQSNLSVEDIVHTSQMYWDKIQVNYSSDKSEHHEANLLMLDCSKANKLLKWKSVWDIETTLEKTIFWYKKLYSEGVVVTLQDIDNYVVSAQEANLIWTL